MDEYSGQKSAPGSSYSETQPTVSSWDSHLGGSGPPALVSHAEAAQALSLGHLVLPRALVLPTAHGGCGLVLQL